MLDSMGDLFRYTLVVFAVVAYLLVLVQVLADLFRDRTASPAAMVVWIAFLLLIPYLAAFAYVLLHGRGMAMRSMSAQWAVRHAADDYIRRVARRSPSGEIAQACALFYAGTITGDEFGLLKEKALS